MSFEKMKEYLESQYIFVKGKEKDYYCDENNKIVATINDTLITLYINDPQDELETQYQVVAFPIINSEMTEQKEQAEQKEQTTKTIKLMGEENDITLENGTPVACYNDELDKITSIIDTSKFSQRNLGKVGIVSNDTVIIPLKNSTISIPLKEETKSKGPIKMISNTQNMPMGYRQKQC